MATDISARDLIASLELEPHPEGGYFREVHRSEERVHRGDDERSAVTTIYFLLEKGRHSRWHVIASDEVWHFLHGEPLELITLDPEAGTTKVAVLGPITDGASTPVHVVPARHWQAARPRGGFSLVGCTVGPGFEFADFRFVSDIAGHERVLADQLAEWRDLL